MLFGEADAVTSGGPGSSRSAWRRSRTLDAPAGALHACPPTITRLLFFPRDRPLRCKTWHASCARAYSRLLPAPSAHACSLIPAVFSHGCILPPAVLVALALVPLPASRLPLIKRFALISHASQPHADTRVHSCFLSSNWPVTYLCCCKIERDYQNVGMNAGLVLPGHAERCQYQ